MLSTLLSLFLTTVSLAHSAPTNCGMVRETHMGVYLQRTWFEETGVCMLSISPADAYQNLVYRDYSLSSDGMFMVFNLYGGDSDFGVREFFMFPRTENLSYQWKDDSHELLVKHVTGAVFTFDSKTAQLKSVSNATVKVADQVSRNNRGGVEISGYNNVLVDTGFTMNQDPTQNRDANSVVKNVGKSCQVKNRNLFQYRADGDIVLRFKQDKDFFTYLKSACPGLQ